MNARSSHLDAALQYAAAGLPVLPIHWPAAVPGGGFRCSCGRPDCPSPAKHPISSLVPHGMRNATTDSEEIRRWWTIHPDANVAIAIPEGMVIVDLDSADAAQRLDAEGCVLPTTLAVKTARGRHLYYWLPPGVQLKNVTAIVPHVDLKAHGGYVLAPPSMHITGARYTWEGPFSLDLIALAPQWIIALTQRSGKEPSARGASTSWGDFALKVFPEGTRNAALARLAGKLYRVLPARLAAELARCWAFFHLQPQLPDPELERTLESIASRESARLQESC